MAFDPVVAKTVLVKTFMPPWEFGDRWVAGLGITVKAAIGRNDNAKCVALLPRQASGTTLGISLLPDSPSLPIPSAPAW